MSAVHRLLLAALTVVACVDALHAAADLLPSAAVWSSVEIPFKESPSPHSWVSQTSRGMRGTVYAGISDVEPGGTGDPGFGVHLQGAITENTRLSVAAVHGPADILSLLALRARGGTTALIEFRHPQWQLSAGHVTSTASSLTGLGVQADGLSFSYDGRVTAKFMAARPKYLGGDSGGHFAHAAIGIRVKPLLFSVVATDLARTPPAGARVRVVPSPTISTDRDVDDLQQIAALIGADHRLRVFGGEVLAQMNPSHEFLGRVGMTRATGSSGNVVRGATGETRYSFAHPRLVIGAYARHAPPGAADVQLAGDAASLSITSALTGSWKFVGYGQWTRAPVIRVARPVVNDGVAVGLQYMKKNVRVTTQARRRGLQASTIARETHTINVNVAVPTERVTISADVEAGNARDNGMRHPYRSVRGRIGFFEDAPLTGGVSITYDELGVTPIRSRIDADVSLALDQWLLEAGVGSGRGQLLGDMRHVWANAEAPLPGALTLVGGIDYVAWDAASSPYLVFTEPLDVGSPWRVTLGIRSPLALPLTRRARESRGDTP